MAFVFIIAFITTVGFCRYIQPLHPLISTAVSLEKDTQLATDIPWPTGGAQASIGTVSDGILASEPSQTPQPTASTAKLITVLTVLKEKPLALGEQGPIITMDSSDVAIYNAYVAANGSVASVQAGEQLTEYQLLQGILIRSANNFADSLAIWAFGNLTNYQKAAEATIKDLGMTSTTIGTDASGLNPATTSTAEDLTRLGIAAMKNEVVRDIVGQSSVTLPIDGTKPSTNVLLGSDGVVGVKTGNTDEAGGVFIIASNFTPENQKPITIISTVQGEATVADAMTAANQLVDSVKPFFADKKIVTKGELVGTITAPWGDSTKIVASKDISLFGWKNTMMTPKIILHSQKAPIKKGATVGTISAGGTSVDLVTENKISSPSFIWRLMTDR